jgi:predicted DNA-binding protein YlxM (UPF0122 family)
MKINIVRCDKVFYGYEWKMKCFKKYVYKLTAISQIRTDLERRKHVTRSIKGQMCDGKLILIVRNFFPEN